MLLLFLLSAGIQYAWLSYNWLLHDLKASKQMQLQLCNQPLLISWSLVLIIAISFFNFLNGCLLYVIGLLVEGFMLPIVIVLSTGLFHLKSSFCLFSSSSYSSLMLLPLSSSLNLSNDIFILLS